MSERPLQVVVGEMLRAQELTLGLVESSTGGLVGHRITEVPGSSDYFTGSLVPYARSVQEQIVGVGHATLEQYGVVSAQTAREMARGARRLFQVDVGVSVTGIAGPAGRKRSKKPVGLTYIGLAAADLETCERHVFGGNRSENKSQSAEAALYLLKRYLQRRIELPQLHGIVDSVDPRSAPELAVVRPAEGGVSQFPIRKRLGVLSSAFNPLTTAHVCMAELAMQQHRLDEVMFELSKVNVDKRVYGAALSERLWMLTRFTEGRPRFSVAMCSHARFIDKAKAILESYPQDTELFFIVGYDTLVRVFDPKYYGNLEAELGELFDQSQFIAANRGEHSLADVEEFLRQPACLPFANKIHLIELDPSHAGLSSTQVRERVEQGSSIAGLVPDEIVGLIPLTAIAQASRRRDL
ncbi:MAG: nicotinamide-nucleotide amidohydrolase family protein [Anaerolineae bacterium]